MANPPRSYTPGEKRRRAWLLARTTKQAIADAVDPRLEAELDRIDVRAEERARVEAEELAKARQAEAQRQAAEKAARKVRRGR